MLTLTEAHDHPFTRQYLATAVWADLDEDLDRSKYDLSNLDTASFGDQVDECEAFMAKLATLLPDADDDLLSQAGHDFWLTRNGHGAGFWGRPEIYGGQGNADTLTRWAKEAGERSLMANGDTWTIE